jgi:hypothetical protein
LEQWKAYCQWRFAASEMEQKFEASGRHGCALKEWEARKERGKRGRTPFSARQDFDKKKGYVPFFVVARF